MRLRATVQELALLTEAWGTFPSEITNTQSNRTDQVVYDVAHRNVGHAAGDLVLATVFPQAPEFGTQWLNQAELLTLTAVTQLNTYIPFYRHPTPSRFHGTGVPKNSGAGTSPLLMVTSVSTAKRISSLAITRALWRCIGPRSTTPSTTELVWSILMCD